MPRAKSTSKDAPPTQAPAANDGRREDLVKAAYEVVVELGFEGLRTRLVAERVGINIATLHYYFSTKEALISAVAAYLSSQFANVHAPAVTPQKSAALTRLSQEFADARFYLQERPDMIVVMEELELRARRDDAVKEIIAPFRKYWEAGIRKMIETGLAEKVFREGLQPISAATFIAAAFAGALRTSGGAEALERVCAEIERWLLREPPAAKATAARGVRKHR